MLHWLIQKLGADTYFPHSICLTNDAQIIGLYTVANLTIWASYTVMGFLMIAGVLYVLGMLSDPELLVMTRKIIRLFPLYGTFIILCGQTHATEVLVLYQGVYRLDLAVVVLTAIVSAITAAITVNLTINLVIGPLRTWRR